MTDSNERSSASLVEPSIASSITPLVAPSVTPSMARIEAALAGLGTEHEPPPGWETRVLAAVGAHRRRWWTYAAPGVALAAAAAVAVVVLHRPPPALALNVEVQHSARFRGDEAAVGDVAHIAVSGGGRLRAIWVYREDGQLVLQCPGDATCRSSHASPDASPDGSMEVDLTLSTAGTYHVVAVTAVDGVRLTGNYYTDTAAAQDAGLDVRQYHLSVAGR